MRTYHKVAVEDAFNRKSTMDYEKMYKDALERAIYVKENTDSVGAKDVSDVIEYIFHGLKESEDEKIMKEIISALKFANVKGVYDKHIALLEKQGERKEYTFKSLPRMLDMIEPTSKAKAYCQKLVDTLVKEGYFTDAKIVGECLKKMNGEDVPMAIMDEKQDEQKPADNVEPKFKIGDWIVQQGVGVFKIIEICKFGYEVIDCMNNRYSIAFLLENECHLWTIQDAKDGDVLQLGEVTAIFRNYIGNKLCICYCSFCKTEGFEIPLKNGEDNVYGCYNATPAAKEQRDTLMKAMSDAGYTFDFEKKELKKIHNALEECEIEHMEHGKYYYCIKDYFAGGKKQASKGDVVQALRWLPIMALGVKANEYFLPVNSIKQNHAWSEEDEKMVKDIIAAIDTLYYHGMVKWLKSLKERVQS